MPAPSYLGITVTLTAAQANRIAALLEAVVSRVGKAAREVTIQADPGNAAGSTIRIGDSTVDAATRCGYVLSPGDSRTYRAGDLSLIMLGMIYAYPSAAALKLNIEIQVY